MDEFLRRLRYYFRRREFEAELEEEIEHHTALSGRKQFGNVTRVKEKSRAMWGWVWLEQLGQDLRYAVRSMASNRGFTALAVVSLALGIGANTAIFSFLESIFLRPLPVREPESLVVLKWTAPGFPPNTHGISTSTGGTHRGSAGEFIGSVFPYPALDLFEQNTALFSTAFAYFAEQLTVASSGGAEAAAGQYVSGGYFAGMGVGAAAGRLIEAADDRLDAPPTAVLSYGFGRRIFGDAASAVGQTIHVNNEPFTVIGVTAPEFFGADPERAPAIYLPMHSTLLARKQVFQGQSRYLDRAFYWAEMMARLRPGVSISQAQDALEPQFRRFSQTSTASGQQPANLPKLTVLEGAGGVDSLRHKYSGPLFVLIAMVSLILLIACANIANLLLARAAARQREIAVRLSMGASRWRVIRQLLTESVLLAVLGGVFGCGLAAWGIRLLTSLLAGNAPDFTLRADLNWQVLGAAFALSVATGLAFGCVPALRATRRDMMPALHALRGGAVGGKSRSGMLRMQPGQVLVVAQVAFSLLLLTGAGLFAHTLWNLRSIQVGFNPDHVLVFGINPSLAGYEGPALNRLYADVQERIGRIPGVVAASRSSQALPADTGSYTSYTIRGVTLPDFGPLKPGTIPVQYAGSLSVGPEFFETMQIQLRAGRVFNDRDTAQSRPVVVVDERFVEVYGLDDPVGLTLVRRNESFEIAGVVRDALHRGLKDERRPVVYFPLAQVSPARQATFEVRTAGDPLRFAPAIRRVISGIDARIAVADLTTQQARVDQTIRQEITLAWLGAAFALLALAIAVVGLYGITAYNVARRTGEIGIRMALGAQRGRVIWMVVREAGVLCLIGVGIGVAAALAASRLVASFLFETQPNDPVATIAAVAVLLGSALAAALVPARRASRIDPMAALRHE